MPRARAVVGETYDCRRDARPRAKGSRAPRAHARTSVCARAGRAARDGRERDGDTCVVLGMSS